MAVEAPGAAPSTVEVVDQEVVVARGHERVTWFVRIGDSWQAAARIATATSTLLDTAPGVVWARRIELELPAGTRLLRRTSRPGPRTHRDALDYLRAEARAVPRAVQQEYFVVNRRGDLAALPAPPGAGAARKNGTPRR